MALLNIGFLLIAWVLYNDCLEKKYLVNGLSTLVSFSFWDRINLENIS